MGKLIFPAVITLMLAAIGFGGYYVFQKPSGFFTSKPALPTVPVAPAPEDGPTANAPLAEPTEPIIEHPIDAAPAAEGAPPLPALAQSDGFINGALGEIVKRRDMLTFLQLDGFAKRAVATVDNLARPHAAPLLWPVNPTPGRFSTLTGPSGAKGDVISPANAQRYTPMVNFIDSIDSAKAAAVYVRLYPLLQEAYVELGYPKGYFNDRLVTVIDHLLATPTPAGPLRVRLTEAKGPINPARPWVRYEFEDSKLEGLSSGQKLLIRTGPENQSRLQAKLRELRQQVVRSGRAAGAARP